MRFFREALGDELRELRAKKALSLRQASNLAAISPAYLGEIERGLKEIGSEKLGDLTQAYGLTMGDLIVRVGLSLSLEAKSPDSSEGSIFRQLSASLQAIGPEEARTLLDFAEYLADRRKARGQSSEL